MGNNIFPYFVEEKQRHKEVREVRKDHQLINKCEGDV